jgi:hypothetical protein
MGTDRDTSPERTTDSTDVQERLDRLESVVEAQQETIQQQRERITELEGETDGDDTPLLANRRNALKADGLLALLFGGVGTASADSQGQVGTTSDPLSALYTDEINDLTQIRSNDSLTVDIDANNDSTSETFTVQQDKGFACYFPDVQSSVGVRGIALAHVRYV